MCMLRPPSKQGQDGQTATQPKLENEMISGRWRRGVVLNSNILRFKNGTIVGRVMPMP